MICGNLNGSFENEALENEAPKTRKRSTQNSKAKTPKSRKRSTQNSKTKHPRSKTKTPKSRKRSTLDRKRSTQKLETGLSFINTRPMLIQQESSTITNRMQFKSTQVVNAFPPLRGRPGGRPCFGRDQKTENAQTISRMLLYCQ